MMLHLILEKLKIFVLKWWIGSPISLNQKSFEIQVCFFCHTVYQDTRPGHDSKLHLRRTELTAVVKAICPGKRKLQIITMGRLGCVRRGATGRPIQKRESLDIKWPGPLGWVLSAGLNHHKTPLTTNPTNREAGLLSRKRHYARLKGSLNVSSL